MDLQKNPPASKKELFLTFLMWHKLHGYNNGMSDDISFELAVYSDMCKNGIPQEQLGRIDYCRRVDDSKPYGEYNRDNNDGITFIRSGLCMPDEEMEKYESLFNESSVKLRRAIHRNGFDIETHTKDLLNIATGLDLASRTLFRTQNVKRAKQAYIKLGRNFTASRTLSPTGIMQDNFVLEQFTGQTITEICQADESYLNRISTKRKISEWDLEDEVIAKDNIGKRILYGIDFDIEEWEFELNHVGEILRSSEEVANPALAAYLLNCLTMEREKSLYTSDVYECLHEAN